MCWWDPTASPAIKPCAQVSRWRERRWSQRHGWLFPSRAVLNAKGAPTHTLRHLHQTDVPCRDHLTSSWPSAPRQTQTTSLGVQCGLWMSETWMKSLTLFDSSLRRWPCLWSISSAVHVSLVSRDFKDSSSNARHPQSTIQQLHFLWRYFGHYLHAVTNPFAQGLDLRLLGKVMMFSFSLVHSWKSAMEYHGEYVPYAACHGLSVATKLAIPRNPIQSSAEQFRSPFPTHIDRLCFEVELANLANQFRGRDSIWCLNQTSILWSASPHWPIIEPLHLACLLFQAKPWPLNRGDSYKK